MTKRMRCSVDGCDKPRRTRGWCSAHYERWRSHGDPMGGGTAPGAPWRFIVDVALRHTGDECLVWPFYSTDDGWPQINFKGRTKKVHTLVCEMVNGPACLSAPFARHRCGNKPCISPTHLVWSNKSEIEAAKIDRGTSNRGERCGSSKLTEDEVISIYNLRGRTRQADIAEQFRVQKGTVAAIHQKKRWAWLLDRMAS